MKTILKQIIVFTCFPVLTFAYTGEVVKSFNTPGAHPTGLTFDGKYLWLADRKTDKLYCIDTASGKVIREIPSPAYWPTGLAWDGTNLWNADVKGGIPLAENYNGKIYKMDPKSGKILNTVQAPSSTPRGLVWDGKYLWCTDSHSAEIIQFDPKDGTTIKSFKAPAKDPRGLAFDGKYLWISDRRRDEIYMMDTEYGNVILIANAPGPFCEALCYDGKFLWAADYQNKKLYKLKVNDGEKFKRDNARKAKITYTHLATNFGPGKVNTLDVYFAMPIDRDNQEIKGEIKYSPKYSDVVTDKWGQKFAHYSVKDINAGGSNEIQMTSVVTTYDVRYFIYPDKVEGLEKIPAGIKSKYLENNEKFQYDNPVIQSALSEALGDEKNPYWIARKIFNYVIATMQYEMTGGWNTAPTVLKRGTGSCSEYSFVYIAMCRAAGLPARYVGSVVERGDKASMDDVFHRWVEVYLPGYGWIPVDPSGGDDELPRDQADSFGALVNRFYITTESGGGSEFLEWTYNSHEFYTTDPKTNVVIEYFADWDVAE
ncbi:MAG: transglutaminase [Bacteroidetes bacterium]|nr:transglutaminase [Bacteroidota bacterium]